MTEASNWKLLVPSKRGFAGMTLERRQEIARLGGKAVPASKRAFSVNKNLAKTAGSKGGLAPRPRSFSLDPDLASRAGKIGKRTKAVKK